MPITARGEAPIEVQRVTYLEQFEGLLKEQGYKGERLDPPPPYDPSQDNEKRCPHIEIKEVGVFEGDLIGQLTCHITSTNCRPTETSRCPVYNSFLDLLRLREATPKKT